MHTEPEPSTVSAAEITAFLIDAERRIDDAWDEYFFDDETPTLRKAPVFEACALETLKPVPPTLRSGELADGSEAWMPDWLFIEES